MGQPIPSKVEKSTVLLGLVSGTNPRKEPQILQFVPFGSNVQKLLMESILRELVHQVLFRGHV